MSNKNPIAKTLSDPKYRKRIVKNKKNYVREKKVDNEPEAEATTT